MEGQEIKRPAPTPKAVIHLKYGNRACYEIEEVKDSIESSCPGLFIPQQVRSRYRCRLTLPEFSVTSDICTRKKDAEQSAAKIAMEKLGIQPTTTDLTPQEAWNQLIDRISVLFSEEFLSSSHPLTGHIRVALGRIGDLSGMIPLSAIAACDVKVNSLCKIIDPKADTNPLLVASLIMKAARASPSVRTTDQGFWIQRHDSYSYEALQSLMSSFSGLIDSKQIEAVFVPCLSEEHAKTVFLDVSDNHYYMDEIAQKLHVRDASQLLVSRTVGKSSSEMKIYFSYPEIPLLASGISEDPLSNVEVGVSLEPLLNKQASYLSGQRIYGDAILVNVGYTWKSSNFFYEDVSLHTYYRMLLLKAPDGYYKLSREAILAAELPTVFTSRTNWKGPLPKDLLYTFCCHFRLSEPHYSVKNLDSSEYPSEPLATCKKIKLPKSTGDVATENGSVGAVTNGKVNRSSVLRCELKLLSRKQEPLFEFSFNDTYTKESDAFQNAALKVLTWLNKYFKQLDMPLKLLSSFHNITIHPPNFSHEFATLLSIYGAQQNCFSRQCSSLESICNSQPDMKQENGMILLNIEGPDSGVFPSPGSLTCISYSVTITKKGEPLEEVVESKDEFEFEVGTGAVIHQLEACVTQLSVNQVARFVTQLPSLDLILAASGEWSKRLSHLSLENCFLEYCLKVLRVTEPLEDRMEQALFSPPLSKQRVEFAVRHINESHATTLVDFGCGSGSLLDSLLEHTTSLEKMVGVDISRKSLTRAAKILHLKLSRNSATQSSIKSAVLYDGSITNFDSRLYDFEIGTCLEVIEHMEETQACLFGDIVLSSFRPRILIVSTPNYEYNPILQRSALPSKEDDSEDKSAPCKFRNHDHKFEWTRQQFNQWAANLAARHSYSVEFSGVGGSGDIEPGFASQIAVFRSRLPPAEKICLRNGEPSHPYEVIWEWSNNIVMKSFGNGDLRSENGVMKSFGNGDLRSENGVTVQDLRSENLTKIYC